MAYEAIATQTDLALKQDKTDNNLATTSKTVVGSINELNGVKISVGATAPIDTVFWLDTTEPGYDPSSIATAINEHNTNINAHLITDSVTSKQYRLVITNGILGIEEVN